MQQQQMSNLMQLIRTSPVLNAQERQEWLQLFDVMNEQQMLELEKILKSNAPPVKPPAGQGLAAGISLSHIVNMPQVQSVQPGSLNAQKPGTQLTAKPKPPLVPVPSKFAAQLEAMVHEKELPPGHPEPLVEFRPKPQSFQSQPQKQFTPKPIAQSPAVKPEAQPQVMQDFSALVRNPAPIKISPQQVVRQQPKKAPEPENKFQPGLQNMEFLVKAKMQQEQAVKIKPPVQLPEVIEKKAASAPDLRSLEETLEPTVALNSKLDEAKDVAGLSLRVWKNENTQALVKKLRSLIANFGYHTIIFSLEQSPLYKTYITTGVELLQEGQGFDGSEAPGLEAHLDKRDFENFTDLLRQIQAN